MLLTAAPDPVLQTTSIVQASAAVATFIVALLAALFALRQVQEIRRTRQDTSRPYVAAFLEVNGMEISLVVKNFGATVARDVTMASATPMQRARAVPVPPGGSPTPTWESLDTFNKLPVLVPGQEWRTLFDYGSIRFGVGLDEPYDVTVSYSDSRGEPLPSEHFLLDWMAFGAIIFSTTKNDVALALEKVAKTLDNWDESGVIQAGGLSVIVRDGLQKDALLRLYAAERQRGSNMSEAEKNARTALERTKTRGAVRRFRPGRGFR